MELITKQRYKGDSAFYNDMTKEFDNYLLYKGTFETYIMEPEEFTDGRSCALRVPGATRGAVVVDENNVITEIVLYEDTCFGKVACYDRSILDILPSYIGAKLVFVPEGLR
jgi:hypothetical protein